MDYIKGRVGLVDRLVDYIKGRVSGLYKGTG